MTARGLATAPAADGGRGPRARPPGRGKARLRMAAPWRSP